MRLPRAVIALVFLAAPLAAQTVRGHVVDTAGRRPLAGALVELSDSSGRPLMRMLTSASGSFTFLVPGPARYLLRAAAIGYLPVAGRGVTVTGGDLTLPDIALAHTVFMLPDLVAAAKVRACGLAELRGGTFADVLESAHTALQVASAAFDARALGFRVRFVQTRELDGDRKRMTADTSIEVISTWPLRSTDADSLQQVGFAREPTESEPAGEIYYGPDARVLFADWFLDTHCFSLEVGRDGEATDSVRMHFAPKGKPRLVDLEGEMVFDQATMSLRRLEFRHVHLPDWVPAGSAGGSIAFDRWPSGLWLPVSWSIRGPVETLVYSGPPPGRGLPLSSRWIAKRVAAGMAVLTGRVLEVLHN